ncbi:MAG: single-stranded-DNA-specific exonuclease RecJ, partial [bacterium]|nr:single-stranded-DNA-specific exonuclease RecJ [bacterium]
MKKEKVLKDKRLIDYLNNRGIKTQEELRSFLNPSLVQLNNPFLLDGINSACQIIKEGLKINQKFVIVGDYDCDGIMASTILYQYFASQNAQVKVYIPNRFDDGYGLSNDLIDQIISEFDPNILITVDLGISCVNEVDYLNKKGVKVIVTDHHEPQSVLPDCVIVDPKVKSNYPCNYLCGAGVAFKLVSALAGNQFANKFLDVVSIATIGDIVPLLGENRVIASVGLDKINNGEFSLKSLKFMFDELGLERVNSSDVYLKIVPKINASGRMDNAQKVFNYLNLCNEKDFNNSLAEILADNAIRLDKINEAMESVDLALEKEIKSKSKILCVKGDYHQGVLGIIASRIVSDYNLPAIVFAKTKEGTLKASGRSCLGLNLHELISKHKDLCLHFGGHKMAIGLEIKEELYDKFVSAIKNDLTNFEFDKDESDKVDIFIKPSDINKKFIDEVNLLAPFGCDNPKPNFGLAVNSVMTKNLSSKSDEHLKLVFENNPNVVYFYGKKDQTLLSSNASKIISLDLDLNYFKGNESAQAIVKKVIIKEPLSLNDDEFALASKAVLLAKSINKHFDLNSAKKDDFCAKSGKKTLIIAQSNDDVSVLKGFKTDDFIISTSQHKGIQNEILIKSRIENFDELFSCFDRVILLSAFSQTKQNDGENVSVLNKIENYKISETKEKCALIYSALFKNEIRLNFDSIFNYINEV